VAKTDVIKSMINQTTLASPPELLLKIISSIEADKGCSEIGEYLSRDQNLTSQILRLANSSFFGFRNEIKTVDRAISVLGMKMIRDIVLAAVLISRSQKMALINLDVAKFWMHSVLTGEFARVLAPLFEQSPDEMYVAGLLHDLGKLVLYSQPQEETDIFEQEFTDEDVAAYEQKQWGVINREVTVQLLTQWGLPQSLVDAVKLENNLKTDSPSAIQLIIIANELAAIATEDWRISPLDFASFEKTLKQRGISLQTFYERAERLPESGEKVRHVMGALLHAQKQDQREWMPERVTVVCVSDQAFSAIFLRLMDLEVDLCTLDQVSWLDDGRIVALKKASVAEKSKRETKHKRILHWWPFGRNKDNSAVEETNSVNKRGIASLAEWIVVEGMVPEKVLTEDIMKDRCVASFQEHYPKVISHSGNGIVKLPFFLCRSQLKAVLAD
jgi:HD-like signal output (HDOD) protein